MPESERGGALGDELARFTSEIHQIEDQPPDRLIEEACARLGGIEPLSSAGMFQLVPETTSLGWLHLSNPSLEFMNQSLRTNHADLSGMLANGGAVQFNASQEGSNFFIGVPAGQYNGSQIGLGVSCSRFLEDNELTRLGPLGLILGLMVENARLSQDANDHDDASSTARLVGFIAHELRTPLTGMRGNIQLALMASRKEQYERIPGRLESAIESVDSMSSLVQKLLDVSRLERGAVSLNIIPASLSETVEDAVKSINAEISGKTWSVRAGTGDAPVIEHDQEAIRQALYYLVENFGPYAEHDSEITISINEESDSVELSITYAGAPFSDEEAAALAIPLSRAQSSSARNEYLSLDLAYCRGVMNEHNGHVDSRADFPSPGRHTIALMFPGSAANLS